MKNKFAAFISFQIILQACLVLLLATTTVVAAPSSKAYALTLDDPIADKRLTDTFRIREKHPVNGTRARHTGVDLVSTTGNRDIRAPGNGTVGPRGYQYNPNTRRGAGYYAYINHGSGVRTLYAHLPKSSYDALTTGRSVQAGEVIGQYGNTGGSTGAHLHYEIQVQDSNGRWVAIDPEAARGKDLTDPSVRAALIADAHAKLEGNAYRGTASGGTPPPGGNTGSGQGQAKACAEDIKSSLEARAQIGANKESERARKAHEKPDSVLKYSCFDQAANTIAQRAGSIFTGSLVGPFRNVLGPTIGGMLENFVGGNIQSLLGDTLGSFVSSVIPFAQSEFNCKIMQAVWDIIECQGFDFNFPSLGEIAGLGRLNLGCEGQVLYGLAADQASSAIAAEIGPNKLGIDKNFIRSVMYDFAGN